MRSGTTLLAAFTLPIAAFIALFGACEAEGQVPPHVTLARVVKLECDTAAHPHCENDAAGIYHVGLARYGERWAQGLLAYSRLNERTHERARSIRSLTPVSMLPTRREQAAWHRLLWLARRIIAGAVSNPAPGAVHWGSPTLDTPTPRMVPVRTTRPTRNTFYALRARGGEA